MAQPGRGLYELPRCEALDKTEDAIRTAALVNEFGFKTRQTLDHHSVNERRRKLGQLPANFILMRDAGNSRPNVQGFSAKWGLESSMIADLPAELGIGRVLDMSMVELAPGNTPEDYRKRAELGLSLAGKYDFVYVHLKGPDEPGHDGLFDQKKSRIEEIDGSFFSVLEDESFPGKTVLCVTCDHSTPWQEKGHSDDPVPVLFVGGPVKPDGSRRFSESQARRGVLGFMDHGWMLMSRLIATAA